MTTFDPTPGQPIELAHGLIRILAPNPSPMTFRGTNTYILGAAAVTVIDPGPDAPDHMRAILAAIGHRPVQQIIVTHSHLDHSPLARALAQATNAPVLAFGDSFAGRSAIMATLAASGDLGGGEGVDHTFCPDQTLADGETIPCDLGPLRVLHTPGHLGNHICLRWGDAIFSGDHVMGWASSLVSPPEGDLTDFMASCARLLTEKAQILYPGHGAPVADPQATISALIAHRHARESQILGALTAPMTAAAITDVVYIDTPTALRRAAERNVLAHLIDLTGRGLIAPQGALARDATFVQIEHLIPDQ